MLVLIGAQSTCFANHYTSLGNTKGVAGVGSDYPLLVPSRMTKLPVPADVETQHSVTALLPVGLVDWIRKRPPPKGRFKAVYR